MSQSLQLFVALILAVVIPPLLFACAAPPPQAAPVDGHLRPCPDTPNCLNSEAESGRATIEPLAYKSSSDRAWQNLKRVIGETGGKIVAEESGYLRAVYTSQLLRFKDDVEFRLEPAVSVIQLRSASRIGYWDLGANRRRVERIRKLFAGLDERNGQ